jgi:hypothetical protein
MTQSRHQKSQVADFLENLFACIRSKAKSDNPLGDFTFRKVVRALTPSGLGDNGMYLISHDEVHFPKSQLQDAIIETISVRLRSQEGVALNSDTAVNGIPYQAIRITIGGHTWLIAPEIE